LIHVPLSPGVNDPADLAQLPGGKALFCDAVRHAVARHLGRMETDGFEPMCGR
jgi:hypothetical protein